MEVNVKFSVTMDDGLAVEAVSYGTGTLCISTQIGCQVGCPFCLSGARGYFRNLTLEELIRQLDRASEKCLDVKRVTLSGIGEPLHNLENVLRFLDFCRKESLPVSLTTTGGPLSNLEKIFPLPKNGLILSLHAGTSLTHRKLIPRGPSFPHLWKTFSMQLSGLSRRKRRKIGINYLLLQGVNDSIAELDRLLMLLKPFPELTLHLLGCNGNLDGHLKSPPPDCFDKIYAYLRDAFPNVRRNNRWRIQKNGGCGTLMVSPGSTCF